MKQPSHETYAVRPCEHNDWDDVRTRYGYKLLRCRVCQGRWKLPSQKVPRCMDFLHEKCEEGERCWLLHVRRKKSTVTERFEKFGGSVLERVSPDIQEEVSQQIGADQITGEEGPPELLEE